MTGKPGNDIPPSPTIEEAMERIKASGSFSDRLTDEQLEEYFRLSKQMTDAGVPEASGHPSSLDEFIAD